MRPSTTWFFLLAALFALLLPVLVVGCGDDDGAGGSSSGTAGVDAGAVDAFQPDGAPANDGRSTTPFNLVSARSVGSTKVELQFDGLPDPDEASKAESYSITGLSLVDEPLVVGQVVTLTTDHQSAQEYTVKVGSNVKRVPDGEPLTVDTAMFTGTDTFNVASAVATSNTTVVVTFDDLPNVTADAIDNYSIPDLTLRSISTAGNVITLETSPQSDRTYTLTVSNVTRRSDDAPLAQATVTFKGRPTFDVVSAAATSATKLVVTFSAPPNGAQAADPANYNVPGLTLSAPKLAGNTVTLTTAPQQAQSYTLTVSNVTRASDGEPLGTKTADFTGRTPFAVVSAQSTSSVRMTVTFDAPPDPTQATNPANYSVPNLTVSAPELAGNTVTLTTTPQQAQSYTLTVSNVTRASDGEPLSVATATFDGTPVQAPTVTNVVVTATNPNNGTTPYNTGMTTVVITGTDFATVDCAGAIKGVKLDDTDAAEPPAPVRTTATSCTVDSDTQITATFPAGIRTNATTGWNVIVTNQAGSNSTSAVRFVPVAGLLISEVFTGVSGDTAREFVEIYNPTSTAIDTTQATGIGLRLHIRNSSGNDTAKVLTAVTAGVIPPKGFLLIASSQSEPGDFWYNVRDYTYSTSGNTLVGNGGVYISLSATDNAKVIDKVGWGTQPAGGYEGTALANIPSGVSAQRKPAGGAGHAIDTDSNADDWLAPSTTLTPRGTASAPEP
jgi:hypothetical protein